ncbi:MAG: hypothetical protein DMG31_15960 [Acidobacteria bacterium]|nr:MAG: hypothetical protein DMG31_15960 [Acidobacteriota bacterium]
MFCPEVGWNQSQASLRKRQPPNTFNEPCFCCTPAGAFAPDWPPSAATPESELAPLGSVYNAPREIAAARSVCCANRVLPVSRSSKKTKYLTRKFTPFSPIACCVLSRPRSFAPRMTFRPMWNGSIVDQETNSRWNPYGECTAGKLKGRKLPRIIAQPDFWFAGAEFSPDAQVYSGAR